MRLRKSLSILTAVAVLLSLLAGCAGGAKPKETEPTAPAAAPAEPQKVELRAIWWGSQDRHDKTLKAIEAFTKKYPHITITSEFSGNDVYWEKVSVKAASGDAPDIINMDFAYINEYSGRQALLDLTPYVGKELDIAKVDKNLLDSGKVGGKLFGIPLGLNTQAIHLNKSTVEKAGLTAPSFDWTWKDFDNYSKVMKEKLGKDFWFSADMSHERNIFEYWLRQRGKTGLWKGTELNATEQDVADWWKLWDGYRKAGIVPTAEVSTANGGFGGAFEASLWAKMKGATQWGWSNEFERNSGVNKDETIMVPLPRGSATDGHYPKASMYWSVYSKSKNPKEAALFISWFINDPEAAKILSTTRGVPVTPVARDTLKQAGLSKFDTVVFDFVDKVLKFSGGTPEPAPKGNTEVVKVFVRLSQEVAFGRKTPEVAAKEFMAESKTILEKANPK